jgi:hypothetical protein
MAVTPVQSFCQGGARSFTYDVLLNELNAELVSDTSRKDHIVYLLLDSAVFPRLAAETIPLRRLEIFSAATFYIGSGQGVRPHTHLVKAHSFHYQYVNDAQFKPGLNSPQKKEVTIDMIWEGGRGVMPLIVFQNLGQYESTSYEQSMITAIGLQNLTNLINAYHQMEHVRGGPNWRNDKIGLFGCYLLEKALKVYDVTAKRKITLNDVGPPPPNANVISNTRSSTSSSDGETAQIGSTIY